jgi:hypothetical protein
VAAWVDRKFHSQTNATQLTVRLAPARQLAAFAGQSGAGGRRRKTKREAALARYEKYYADGRRGRFAARDEERIDSASRRGLGLRFQRDDAAFPTALNVSPGVQLVGICRDAQRRDY